MIELLGKQHRRTQSFTQSPQSTTCYYLIMQTSRKVSSKKYLKKIQSIKYLHFIIHFIFYYISKRCKASNISTISPLYHPLYLKKMQSIKYLHNISTLSSIISQKDAKHQISPLYLLQHLKKMQSIKYLYFILYFISKRCKASNISTLSSTLSLHSQFNIHNSTFVIQHYPLVFPLNTLTLGLIGFPVVRL